MSESYPHFFCDCCSNVIRRESDYHAMREGEDPAVLLARVREDLPACCCGGRFRPGEAPKCPNCRSVFKHEHDELRRLEDPVMILMDGAVFYDETGPRRIYRIEPDSGLKLRQLVRASFRCFGRFRSS
ncbi:hypothetical protein [Pontivivens ytuae]|uniref:Uncharacterized protein n=1 Tax=Pontivivens ytuae TaxID=2789856 RepID=A0A7S9QCL0_9RHOB|nr:hypothetical protein [Pontivivens ytuae]QPH54333.1 hypothetical protein I0K15_00705 [Pontivivens ytuae]